MTPQRRGGQGSAVIMSATTHIVHLLDISALSVDFLKSHQNVNELGSDVLPGF